jgi:hypothetical protein
MAIEVGYESVSWETASDWTKTLEQGEAYGFRQRQRTDGRVDSHFEAMINGRFRAEASGTIDFHKLGFLVNGQHRLGAQIKAKITLNWLVRRGLEDDDVKVLDLGAKRSAPDVFRMSGHVNSTRLSATIKRLHVLAGGNEKEIMSAPLAEAILRAHPHIEDSVAYAKMVSPRIAPDTNFAAIHYLGAFFQKKEQAANEYVSLIAKGLMANGEFPSSPNNVAIKLREFMSEKRSELLRDRARWQYDVPLKYAAWGWLTYLAGATPRRIVLPDEMPRIEGWDLAACLGAAPKGRKSAKKSR